MTHNICKYLLCLALLAPLVVSEPSKFPGLYKCDDADIGILKEDYGTLLLTRTMENCRFQAKQESSVFAIKTDNLNLDPNEMFSIEGKGGSKSYEMKPPLSAGWVIVGIPSPSIGFKMDKNSTIKTTLSVPYSQVDTIPINDGVSDTVALHPFGVSAANILAVKVGEDHLHVDIDSKHYLIKKESEKFAVKFVDDKPIVIKSTYALKDCSEVYTDTGDNSHNIVGPDLTKIDRPYYECVNIFQTTKGHFEVDFKDFLGLSDADDELIIGDSLVIKKPQDNYQKKVLSFNGNELPIIYRSPAKVNRSTNIQFKLTVNVKSDGGLLEEKGVLEFNPKVEKVRYVLRPASNQFASIKFADKFTLQDNQMIISSNNMQATFLSDAILPPVMALERANEDMTIDFFGKSLEKLSKAITFESLKTHCHRVIYDSQVIVTVKGESQCYFAIGSNRTQIQFSPMNLQSTSKITIYDHDQKTGPIYSGQSNYLPPVTVSLSYVQVVLDKSSSLTATFMPTPLTTPSGQEISSQGYPNSYPWSSETITYKIEATNKNYLFSLVDADIRAGEKIMLDDKELKDDVIKSNVTSLIKVSRSVLTKDFAAHRGFKILAKQIDEVVIADATKQEVASKGNTMSQYIKISAPASGNSTLGSRIRYNITLTSKDKKAQLTLTDGRSLAKNRIDALSGETTSDSLLLLYESKAADFKLPPVRISYQFISCKQKEDFLCDQNTRCVPKELLCLSPRKFFCLDKSDVIAQCNSTITPVPPPNVVNQGLGGFAVFTLCVLMMILGAAGALFGPDLFKKLEARFRPAGQYSSFNSVE